jgi:cytidylate kinase
VKKIITVDGPAGSGKEKISKYIARKYKLYHLDSGILYRRLAYELAKKNIKTLKLIK